MCAAQFSWLPSPRDALSVYTRAVRAHTPGVWLVGVR